MGKIIMRHTPVGVPLPTAFPHGMGVFSLMERSHMKARKEGCMEKAGKERQWVQGIQPGEAQRFRNITVLPLFSTIRHPVDHLVLSEALDTGRFTVREVDEGGCVPRLVVVNETDSPVLILDGEELFGAKQNRVLNTTVLLKKKGS